MAEYQAQPQPPANLLVVGHPREEEGEVALGLACDCKIRSTKYNTFTQLRLLLYCYSTFSYHNVNY